MTALSIRPFPARPPFRNRVDAGEDLAESVSARFAGPSVTVMGIARGGVPAARIVADHLGAPFGVVVTSRVGIPGLPEASLAAITEGRLTPLADAERQRIGVPRHIVQQLTERERINLELRAHMYRIAHSAPEVRGRTIVLVDDGVITGATLRATARTLRAQGARRIIGAVPAASRRGAAKVSADFDDLIVLVTLESLDGLSAIYEAHDAVSDHEVLTLLRRSSGRPASFAGSEIVRDISDRIAPEWPHTAGDDREQTVEIPVRGGRISANLGPHLEPQFADSHSIPEPRGLVIFAQSGGFGHSSYSNRYLAGRTRMSGYATLRVDLLTSAERQRPGDDASTHIDLGLLADRLALVSEWVARNRVVGYRRPILAGSGVGGAVAIATAARASNTAAGVIALGARLDLVSHMLSDVQPPVLLLVGENDDIALRRSADAVRALRDRATLARVPRAGQLFAEPGTLGVAGEHLGKWLERLGRRSA